MLTRKLDAGKATITILMEVDTTASVFQLHIKVLEIRKKEKKDG